MSFIDRTYFSGDLHISQLQQTAVQEKLDYFISIYEPKCLKELLGYELRKEFTDGLMEASPAQKWIDLRDGVEFTGYNGRIKKWMGFTGNTDAVPVGSGGFKPSVQIQVDVTAGLVNNTTSATFDGTSGKPDFRGYKIIPERLGTGTMWAADYSWNAATGFWQLLNTGDKFQPLEKFNISFEPFSTSSTINSDVKQSIIANYVYVMYMKDIISSTTGIGEVKPQGDNASSDNPGWKIFKAWQRLTQWVCEMDEFLNQLRVDYPNYQFHTLPADFCRTVNPLNI
jgi:hypothetical protein